VCAYKPDVNESGIVVNNGDYPIFVSTDVKDDSVSCQDAAMCMLALDVIGAYPLTRFGFVHPFPERLLRGSVLLPELLQGFDFYDSQKFRLTHGSQKENHVLDLYRDYFCRCLAYETDHSASRRFPWSFAALVKLLEQGSVPFRRLRKHRRVRLEDLLKFQAQETKSREAALNELAGLSQELGLYD
jgi:hypothetical protein